MGAWLCEAGDELRAQVDRRWPNRDKRSDGWIGDASHTTGDHVPDLGSTPPGAVRAIDLDANLDKDPDTMGRLTNQLVRYCRDGKDNDRTWYVIYDGMIASRTYGWKWRAYSGADPHTNHAHISFTERGDHRDAAYLLPIFDPRRRRLARLIDRLTDRIEKLRRERARKRDRLRVLA